MKARLNRRQFLAQTADAAWKASVYPTLLSQGILSLASAASGDGVPALASALEGPVLVPSDPRYAANRLGNSLRHEAIHPRAIALCLGPGDVAAAIRWARNQGAEFRIRSGGHSYEALSTCAGLVIDLRLMNGIQVDPVTRIATVQAGGRLGALYQKASEAGLAMVAGSCPSVGIGGLTLGGGFGMLSRKHGLTIDNLLSLVMIDAEGRRVRASRTENPDLFWACRGGGAGSFGAVTEFRFQLHPIAQVSVFRMKWAEAGVRGALDAWQDFAPHAPDELTSVLLVVGSSKGALRAASSGQFVGPPDELRRLLKPLVRSGAAADAFITQEPFISAVHRFGGDPNEGPSYFKGKSSYSFEPLPPAGIDALLNRLSKPARAGGCVILDSYGGAINRVPGDATAFAHREGALFSMQYSTSWGTPSQAPAQLQWIRRLYDEMRPYVSGACYPNYCDLDITDWASAYYGANFERLVLVKGQYDPENVFRHPQSIPPPALR